MISFALTEEQTFARAAAAKFAAAEARPAARAAEENAEFPESLLRSAWALGLAQAAAGGEAVDQPTVLNALALEEIAYGDAALAVAIAGALGFARAVATQGTLAQRERHLPAFQSDTPAFAAVAALDAGWFRGEGRATRARRAGNGWRIDGAKALVPRPRAATGCWRRRGRRKALEPSSSKRSLPAFASRPRRARSACARFKWPMSFSTGSKSPTAIFCRARSGASLMQVVSR